MCETFFKAILAGIMITIGCTVNLMCENKYVGAIMFGTGLLSIVIFQMKLFTGKVGYLVTEHKMRNIGELILILCGNAIGTLEAGNVIRCTRFYGNIEEKVSILTTAKLNDDIVSILFLSFFCGVLMYIAVEGYSRTKSPYIIILPVAVFILSGFEHCVANMAYFTMAGVWNINTVLYTGLMVLGNAAGSMFTAALSYTLSKKGQPI